MKQFKIILVTSILLLSFAVFSNAAEKNEKRPPIDITSDSLEATGGDIIFVGKVNAVYGDMTIKADKMKVLYETTGEKKGGGKTQEVKKIIATDNVELISGKRHAWGDKLVYVREKALATLTGSPKIVEGNNMITGDVIEIHTDGDRRFEAKGNVKVVLNPETLKEK